MEHIAQLTHLHDTAHTVTELSLFALMLIHAIYGIWTYFKGSLKSRGAAFPTDLALLCGFIWLIPYCIGIYMGMSLHK